MSPNLLEIQVLICANWKFSLAFFPYTCMAVCRREIKGDLAKFSLASLAPPSLPRPDPPPSEEEQEVKAVGQVCPQKAQSPEQVMPLLSINWSCGSDTNREKGPQLQGGIAALRLPLNSPQPAYMKVSSLLSEWQYFCPEWQGQKGRRGGQKQCKGSTHLSMSSPTPSVLSEGPHPLLLSVFHP